MALNNRGLGRGIQALFENSMQEATPAATGESPLRIVNLETVHANPDQPRKTFSEASLQDLAASIRLHGILQPLLVRPDQAGDWQLIAGERRLRAAQIAGLSQVPVLVRPLSDQDALIVTLLENLQREDLNPIEEAQGLDALKRAANVGVEELAEMLGQARSTISNTLRLLALNPEIQAEVAKKRLSTSHAKILAGISDSAAALELMKQILEAGMTIRQTEDSLAFWRENGRFPWQGDSAPHPVAQKKRQDPDMIRLGADLSSFLHCRAKISGSQSKGKISLAYDSEAELAAILERLGLTPEMAERSAK